MQANIMLRILTPLQFFSCFRWHYIFRLELPVLSCLQLPVSGALPMQHKGFSDENKFKENLLKSKLEVCNNFLCIVQVVFCFLPAVMTAVSCIVIYQQESFQYHSNLLRSISSSLLLLQGLKPT